MKLARRCQETLAQAELRVTRLQEQFSEGVPAVHEDGAAYEAPVEEPVPAAEEAQEWE